MKVALYVHCFFPDHFYGTETYTLLVAKHLTALGHEAVVVSAVFQGEQPREGLVTNYVYDGVPVWVIDKNKMPHRSVRQTYYQPAMAEVHRDILRRLSPDIVHVTHLINHTGVLLEAAAGLGLPIVGTLTDFFGFCYTNRLVAVDGSLCGGPSRSRANCVACHISARRQQSAGRGAGWRGMPAVVRLAASSLTASGRVPMILDRRLAETVKDLKDRPDVLAACYRHYDVVVTPTLFLRRAYERSGLTTPCVDIRFGVDIDRSAKPDRPEGEPLRVGYIGQIASHKGVDLLVEAITGLPRGAVVLDVYGPKDQDPGYMKKVADMARGFPVRFRGTFPSGEMADRLRALDLIAIPSRWPENSPLVLLDALATHTPVLVSDGEGLTEFLEEGRNGFSFPRGNVGALRSRLRRLIEDRSLAARMSHLTEYSRTSRQMTEDLLPVYARAGNWRSGGT